MRRQPRTFRRFAVAVAGTAIALGTLSGCGLFGDDAAPTPVAALDQVPGGSTAIKLDQGFVDALGSLKLKPATTGRAKLTDGSLIFPITGGNVTVFTPGEVSPYVIGQLQHEGSGFTLSAGKTTVKLSNFNVDPGVSRVYGDVAVNGKTVVTSAYLFTLDGRTLAPLKTQGKTAVLKGTKVEISPVAAPLLNKTFGTKAIKPNFLVGVATITVDTK